MVAIGDGSLIEDRYELDAQLGRGGMAQVWRARDRRLERTVAIKFLARPLIEEGEFLVRFFSEAQSVARITHPHVVRILDFGETDGRQFIVMEYVEGGSAANLTGRPILPERATEIVAQSARGAGAAHELGIVHRDIKPANILLTKEGHAKLADFGIAVTADCEPLTATGAAVGSPHYISPEQASGRTATPASDVYSLGIVLYELLTGKLPFSGDNPTAIAIAHVEDRPEPPGAHVSDLDPSLDFLVMQCLEKDPDLRYPSGHALASALEIGPQATGRSDARAVAGLAPVPKKRAGMTIGAVAVIFGLLLGVGFYVAAWPDPPERLEAAQPGNGAAQTVPEKGTPSPTLRAIAAETTPMSPGTGGPSEAKPTKSTEKKSNVNVADPGEESSPSGSPSPTSSPTSSPTPTDQPSPTPTTEGSSEETAEP